MVIDKLRTAVFVSAFPELRDTELSKKRHNVTRAVAITALFQDGSSVLSQEGLMLAKSDYESALIEAWKSSDRQPVGPGLVADFALSERHLRNDTYRSMSKRWGSLVMRGYQEVASALDWERQRAPRIWSHTVREVTPADMSIPEFEASADLRDNHVAKITLRSLTASSLHLEQIAIFDGSLAAQSSAA